MDKKIIVLDNVDIVTYSAAVNEIANKFFDEEDNYTPHFGRANSIGVFFNRFVDITSLEEYFENYEGEIDIDLFLSNEGCLKAYNEALKDGDSYRLNFANAYADALDIVKTRNSTLYGVSKMLKNGIEKVVNEINPIFTDENIDKLSKLAEDVSKGELSADAIVKAYGKNNFN